MLITKEEVTKRARQYNKYGIACFHIRFGSDQLKEIFKDYDYYLNDTIITIYEKFDNEDEVN